MAPLLFEGRRNVAQGVPEEMAESRVRLLTMSRSCPHKNDEENGERSWVWIAEKMRAIVAMDPRRASTVVQADLKAVGSVDF